MNIIHIAGHLGADPETRFTQTGQEVTSFRVAVNSRKGGKDETTWYRVTVWGDRYKKMIAYLKKGSAVIVVGTLAKPEIYTDKSGQPQISLEITAEMISFSPFGKSEKEGQSQSGSATAQNYGQPSSQPFQGAREPTYASGPTSAHDSEPLPF